MQHSWCNALKWSLADKRNAATLAGKVNMMAKILEGWAFMNHAEILTVKYQHSCGWSDCECHRKHRPGCVFVFPPVLFHHRGYFGAFHLHLGRRTLMRGNWMWEVQIVAGTQKITCSCFAFSFYHAVSFLIGLHMLELCLPFFPTLVT